MHSSKKYIVKCNHQLTSSSTYRFLLRRVLGKKGSEFASAISVGVAASIDTLSQRFDTLQTTLNDNQRGLQTTLDQMLVKYLTGVLTGQQATATSVGATASSPQVPVMKSSASAPTQSPPSSLPSDTTASGDGKLGPDSASAALTLHLNLK